MAPSPSREKLIRCASCGEDYSPTYKKCPFCGARNDPRMTAAPVNRGEEDDFDDGYVFDGQDLFDDGPEDDGHHAKGGKRLAGNDRGAKGDGKINWLRLITFLCSLAIIIAAMVIVFTIIYPQLRGNDPVVPSEPPVDSQAVDTDPVTEPSEDPTPTENVEPSQEVSGGLTGFTLDSEDFTLQAGDRHQLVATFDPADWNGTVTWESSDTRYATVDADGWVTNVNTDPGSNNMVIITAHADGISVGCVVYCVGPEVVEPSQAPAPSAVTGTRGVIINANGGLRVRSGPGISYDVVASLYNGDPIIVIADAGDGWHQISFSGPGGQATTGYIMGDYISTN